jgi:hypothetical protein
VKASLPELPPWLAEYLVSDSAMARAYEGVTPAVHALCKHTLAVQHAFFDEAPDWEEQRLARASCGLRTRACNRPADWALVIFDAEYASAPRLLAALMPALLARVPLVLSACIPGPPRPELLCALELAGQEQIYALDAPQSLDLVRGLAAQPGQGRLVLLHRGALSALRAVADETGVPCWEERRAPVLRICGSEPDAALIRLAHPDAASADKATPDAVYCAEAEAAQAWAPLVFTPGMEGCWLHPSLAPDFFRVRSLTFGLAPAYPDAGDLP